MIKKLKNKNRWVKIVLALLGVRFCCPASATQEVAFAWDPSPSPDVAGYFLYYGTQSGVYPNKLDAGFNTQEAVTNLQDAQTYYFVVTAYDEFGNESLPSGEIQYTTTSAIQLTMGNSSSVNLQFPVASGHWYEIQASTDLRSWTTIDATAVAASNVLTQFIDSQAGPFASRFYRLVMH